MSVEPLDPAADLPRRLHAHAGRGHDSRPRTGGNVGRRRRKSATALRANARDLVGALRGVEGLRCGRRYGNEFARAWELYLAGSQAAFASGWMQLFQILFTPASPCRRSGREPKSTPARESANDSLRRAHRRRRSRGLDVRAHAPAGWLERRRRRPRRLPARQGVRGMADAGRLSTARARPRRISRRGTDPAGDHRVPHRRSCRNTATSGATGSSKRDTRTSSATPSGGASSMTSCFAGPVCASSSGRL